MSTRHLHLLFINILSKIITRSITIFSPLYKIQTSLVLCRSFPIEKGINRRYEWLRLCTYFVHILWSALFFNYSQFLELFQKMCQLGRNQVSSVYSVKPWFGDPSRRTPTVLSFEAVTTSIEVVLKKCRLI